MAIAPAVSPSAIDAVNNNIHHHHHHLDHHQPSPSDLSDSATHIDCNDHQYHHSLNIYPNKQSLPLDSPELRRASLQRPRPPVITPNRPILSRSLTMSAVTVNTSSDTNNPLEPVIGSPPDLSSSKSSLKSASVESSPSNDDFSDVSNFEEISLADLHSSKSQPQKAAVPISRPILRTAYTTQATPTKQTRSSHNIRDLTGDLRATATLNSHAQKHSPRMSWQRSFAPISPSLSIPLRFGSRTPSPTKSEALSTSPVSPRMLTPRAGNENSPILKQGSAQSKRKTQKELEDEYHDSDDELPDDAFIWNIPLTPRPAQSRSPSISPERGSLKARPGDRGLRFTRTKSWSAALSELSEHAKKLTEALEIHHDQQTLHQVSSSPVSNAPLSPRPSMSARSKTVTLPAIQRGDPLLDPLPASKEKERVLTRTRPSWLPPKCPKEEAKHLKEYQRMMSAHVQSDDEKSAKWTKEMPNLPVSGENSVVHVTEAGISSAVKEVENLPFKDIQGGVSMEKIEKHKDIAELKSAVHVLGCTLNKTSSFDDVAILQIISTSTSSYLPTEHPSLYIHLASILDFNNGWPDLLRLICQHLEPTFVEKADVLKAFDSDASDVFADIEKLYAIMLTRYLVHKQADLMVIESREGLMYHFSDGNGAAIEEINALVVAGSSADCVRWPAAVAADDGDDATVGRSAEGDVAGANV